MLKGKNQAQILYPEKIPFENLDNWTILCENGMPSSRMKYNHQIKEFYTALSSQLEEYIVWESKGGSKSDSNYHHSQWLTEGLRHVCNMTVCLDWTTFPRILLPMRCFTDLAGLIEASVQHIVSTLEIQCRGTKSSCSSCILSSTHQCGATTGPEAAVTPSPQYSFSISESWIRARCVQLWAKNTSFSCRIATSSNFEMSDWCRLQFILLGSSSCFWVLVLPNFIFIASSWLPWRLHYRFGYKCYRDCLTSSHKWVRWNLCHLCWSIGRC